MNSPDSKTFVLRPFAPLTRGDTGRQPTHHRQRASLDGLDVQESSFNEWLDAGGERRKTPRDDTDSRG